MNFSLFLPLTVTAVLAIAGWWAVHRLSMNRDQENKRRDLRVRYLLEAYRRLEHAVTHRHARDLETALADILLLGTERQVSLAHDFAVSAEQNKTATLGPLIADIRAELRRELKLDPLPGHPDLFRFTPMESPKEPPDTE